MNTIKLILKEIAHSRYNFALSLMAVSTGVALFVAFFALTLASDLETKKIMLDLGQNLRVIPKHTNMDFYYDQGFSDKVMPQAYLSNFVNSSGLVYTHLTATLQRKMDWQDSRIIVTGVLPEVYPENGKKKDMPTLDDFERFCSAAPGRCGAGLYAIEFADYIKVGRTASLPRRMEQYRHWHTPFRILCLSGQHADRLSQAETAVLRLLEMQGLIPDSTEWIPATNDKPRIAAAVVGAEQAVHEQFTRGTALQQAFYTAANIHALATGPLLARRGSRRRFGVRSPSTRSWLQRVVPSLVGSRSQPLARNSVAPTVVESNSEVPRSPDSVAPTELDSDSPGSARKATPPADRVVGLPQFRRVLAAIDDTQLEGGEPSLAALPAFQGVLEAIGAEDSAPARPASSRAGRTAKRRLPRTAASRLTDYWVQCDKCRKWHVVPRSTHEHYKGAVPFECRNLGGECAPRTAPR